jgi:hypothetical protein
MDIEVITPSGGNLADFWKNLVSNDPDKTDGPIVFLRSRTKMDEMPLKEEITISPNQILFLPIINTAINPADDPSLDSESKRRSAANKDIDDGDNPPDPKNVTIDGIPIVDKLENFRIESPEFNLEVNRKTELEEVTYQFGASLPTVAAGYSLLIKSLPKRDEPYTIHVKANGAGAYSTEAVYTVRVK